MTVVNPKSISGINSITMASGSDNLLTIHTTNTTERVRVNSDGDVIVGSGITVSPDGDIFATGVCTATTFSGSGANLTNLPAANITGTLPAISGANLTNLDASDLASGTVPTARLGSGTASSSTFLRGDSTFATVTSTTINSNADNRLITGSGTANTLNGESGATYDGTDFTVSSGRLKLTDESSGDQLRIGAGGDFTIEHDGSNTYLKNITNDLIIQNDANVKITAKTGGTQRFRFDSDGLKFGTDTAAANALDDYEEGTFTPTMANSVTLHSGNDLLSYVKVGHLVHVTGVVRINSDNSNSVFSITNMPFATVNASDQAGNAIGAVSLYDQDMNSGYSQVISVMNPNSTTLNIQNLRQSGNTAPGLNINANAYIGVNITYRSA